MSDQSDPTENEAVGDSPEFKRGCTNLFVAIFVGAILGGIGYRLGGTVGGYIGWGIAVWAWYRKAFASM